MALSNKQLAKKRAKANAKKRAKAKAKTKTNNIPFHIQQANASNELASFYWGYRANEGDKGFEFSTMTAMHLGLDFKEANGLGATIKKASDAQLMHYINNTTMQEYGLTREQFVAEEKERLLNTTHNLNILTSGSWTLQDIVKDLIIWCCAVSTLVAAGEIPQDEYNGDKFGYIGFPFPEVA